MRAPLVWVNSPDPLPRAATPVREESIPSLKGTEGRPYFQALAGVNHFAVHELKRWPSATELARQDLHRFWIPRASMLGNRRSSPVPHPPRQCRRLPALVPVLRRPDPPRTTTGLYLTPSHFRITKLKGRYLSLTEVMMRRYLIGGVGILLALAVLVVVGSYLRDTRRAYERVRGNSTILASPFEDIEYTVGGRGPGVLVIHGGGGGYDQGELLVEAVLGDEFHWISPSRFGYLGSVSSDKSGTTSSGKSGTRDPSH
jgi:hypothetical protein